MWDSARARDVSDNSEVSMSAGYAPATVTPPRRFLKGLRAARAGLRNPIELWDSALYEVPSRIITRFGGKRFLEIADPLLMHQVLVAEADAFQRSEFQLRFTRPLVGDGILAAVGNNWKAQRRAAAPCFRHQAVAALVSAADAAGERAVAKLREGVGPIDILPVMMSATFDVVSELLGVEAGVLDQATIDRAADDYLRGVGLSAVAVIFGLGWLHRLLPLKSRCAAKKLKQEAARAVIAARRQTDRRGLLARLAEVLGDDPVETNDGLRDSVIAFIAAGNETSAVALTWALHLIAHDQIVQDRLAEEARDVLGSGPVIAANVDALDLHLRVVKEALRLFPPIALVQRTATRAVQIGEHALLPGDEVVCAIYVMHRSERVWDRPEVFDPERFTVEACQRRNRFAFLPFGAGPHACLGMPLAIMEMVAILARITRAVRLDPHSMRPILPVMRLTLRPEGRAPLKITVRTPIRVRPTQSGDAPEQIAAAA